MKILIATNHSYMFYRFRKELVEALMQEHEVILSTPFVGHEDDLQAMGLRCIETDIDRRSINPFKDMKLLKTYRQMLDEFFSAARTLKAEFGEEVAFDVVGFYEDAYREQVDQLVADGIVRFHGFQTDVHPFYEAADCVVLPSYHEGMSNVLLEGAATGRALITSDIPGCREAVEDGVSGYLCPAQDAEGLTQAMRDFAQQSFDRQVQMGQSGRALVERKFDKQLVVAKTLDGLGLPAAVRS